nr:hypothetical protein [Moritella viscosa]SHO14758.1 Phosphocholine cytidylytransferase [Moritella viscosa]
MKKTILAIALTFTLSSVAAVKPDLTQFDDLCVKSYKTSLKRNGQSDLTGVYLRYEGEERINNNFKSLYFNPDYDVDVMFNENPYKKIKTHNLSKKYNTFTFYDHKEQKDGDRIGNKFTLEKITYDTYELSIYKTNRNELGDDRRYIPIYDEAFDFRENTSELSEPIYTLELRRIESKEKSLYAHNTELSLLCRK